MGNSNSKENCTSGSTIVYWMISVLSIVAVILAPGMMLPTSLVITPLYLIFLFIWAITFMIWAGTASC